MDTKVLKEESPVTTALDEDEQRNLTVEDIVVRRKIFLIDISNFD